MNTPLTARCSRSPYPRSCFPVQRKIMLVGTGFLSLNEGWRWEGRREVGEEKGKRESGFVTPSQTRQIGGITLACDPTFPPPTPYNIRDSPFIQYQKLVGIRFHLRRETPLTTREGVYLIQPFSFLSCFLWGVFCRKDASLSSFTDRGVPHARGEYNFVLTCACVLTNMQPCVGGKGGLFHLSFLHFQFP